MWLWSRQEAKKIDKETQAAGISAAYLMESAGQKSASQILKLQPKARSAIILAGPGHNGGDALVVARSLSQQGLKTLVIEIAPSQGTQQSSLRISQGQKYMGPRISPKDFLKNPREADLWIDGLFGIGLSRNLDPEVEMLISLVHAQKGARISLDTPSGLDVNTGCILGAAFHSDWTLTVGHPKPGFFLNQGPEVCGKIISIEIPFPQEICQAEGHSIYLFNRRLAQRWLPKRKATDNKSQGGRCLILAGSKKMPGAGLLACRAALRVGSGYVYTSQPEAVYSSPEILPWSSKNFSGFQSVLIGPGLAEENQIEKWLRGLRQTSIPVVIDADALTVIAKKKLFPLPEHWVATPHAGELSRLLQTPAKKIESDRLFYADQGHRLLGCNLLLKGFHSVAKTQTASFIIPTGNVALAKAGSGDVLSGMIAGLLAQGLPPEKALLLGSYLHGLMADHWIAKGQDFLSLTPTDLIENLPQALQQLRTATF
jgi:NAD(P)H-hydrate epimerase